MPPERPSFIKNVRELPDNGGTRWPGRDEVFSIRTPLSRPLGLVRLGVHFEILEPGRRTSAAHAESVEEECVFVLAGHPQVWVDGERHPLGPDDIVVFPPATGIRHFVFNPTDEPVRLLVIGEREAVSRTRVLALGQWIETHHPELGPPEQLDLSQLLELAAGFEGGPLGEGLRQSWRVGFRDHLFERRSDFEPDPESGSQRG